MTKVICGIKYYGSSTAEKAKKGINKIVSTFGNMQYNAISQRDIPDV